ncbi:MAG: ATP-binding protein [Bdellovibrionaceae bacterium]|nr:ATP-binding protein [Pseudobdellovibrionaceae bacterium]
MSPSIVLGSILLLLLALLGVALFWEKQAKAQPHTKLKALIYSLSFSTFFTTWTYYGNTGEVLSSGYLFLAGDISIVCSAFLWWIVLRKVVRLKHRYHITSIADFISTRYGKSQSLGLIVSLGCWLLLIPYIALQIKAVAITFSFLTEGITDQFPETSLMHYALFAVIMAAGALLLGLRKLDPSEHQAGLVAVIATLSIFRLATMTAAGIFIVYILFDGPVELFSKTDRIPMLHMDQLPANFFSEWWFYLLMSMFGALFLPHQFHVAAVENQDENQILTAMWVSPLFSVLHIIFIVPIAIAGVALGIPRFLPEFFLIQIPLTSSQNTLALLVFLGGFSAAAGMVILALTTSSLMIANYAILPAMDRLASRFKSVQAFGALQRSQFLCRSLAVVTTLSLVLPFLTHTHLRISLVSMGSLAFVATAQFAPAILGGLFWQRGSRRGVLLGLAGGFAIWIYTLVVPSFNFDGRELSWIHDGPFGFGFLRPYQLFGITSMTPTSHSLFWSTSLNAILFVTGSLTTQQNSMEKEIAGDFVLGRVKTSGFPFLELRPRSIFMRDRLENIEKCLKLYLQVQAAERILTSSLVANRIDVFQPVSLATLAAFMREMERRLSGAVGSAQAHRIVESMNVFTPSEIDELAKVYGRRLANIGLTPAELLEKVNYVEERHAILQNHTLELQNTIDARDREERLRKLAEESQERLISTLEETSDFVATVDVGGHITYLNHAARERLGIGRDASIEHLTLRDLHPPDIEKALTEVALPMAFMNRIWRGESRFLGEGGVSIETSHVLIAHKRADGSLNYFSMIARDISAQKRAERELRRAIEASALANRTISEFLATVSHELRTPLNSILGGAELLMTETKEAEKKDEVALILRNGLQLKSIVEDILSFAQISAGKLKLVPQIFGLRSLITDVVRTLKPQADAAGIELKSEVANDIHDSIEADPVRLRQVLFNLVGNAIKFTRRGSVQIRVSLISATDDHQVTRFEIIDTGIGIPLEEQSRIFEPFTQAEPTLERTHGGAGMGLSISKKLLELMQGEIGVTSQVARGSTFWFVLPLKLINAVERKPTSETESQSVAHCRVLLADDSRDNQYVVTRMLKKFGVDCDIVENGLQAVEAERHRAYDLIFMDIMMPVMNGLEAIRQIRSLPRPYALVPIVALSAKVSDEDIRSYLEAGADDVLAKPVTKESLKAEVDKFVSAQP